MCITLFAPALFKCSILFVSAFFEFISGKTVLYPCILNITRSDQIVKSVNLHSSLLTILQIRASDSLSQYSLHVLSGTI